MKEIVKLTNKGIKSYHKNDFYQSFIFFQRAEKIALKNKFLIDEKIIQSINYNIALSLYSMQKYQKAVEYYYKLPENHHEGKYELSMSLFHLNKIDEAKKYYHHRYLKNKTFPNLPLQNIRNIELIENSKSSSILVLNEEGLGDEIMFYRGIYSLSNKFKHVTVQCYPELVELFKNNIRLKNVEFFTSRTLNIEFINKFNYWISSGDVFTNFINDNNLNLKNSKINLNLSKSKFNIGILLTPNKKSPNYNERRIGEDIIEKILNINKNIQLHSLSINEKYPNVIDYSKNINNMNDTLGIIENMDLIITVDTGVAHLSSCSIVETIIIYDKYLDWRWKGGIFYPDTTTIHKDDIIETIKNRFNKWENL